MDRLSDKELNVLKYLSQGLTIKETAQRIGVSHHTVNSIVNNLEHRNITLYNYNCTNNR